MRDVGIGIDSTGIGADEFGNGVDTRTDGNVLAVAFGIVANLPSTVLICGASPA